MTITWAVQSMADVEKVDTAPELTADDLNAMLVEIARGEKVARVSSGRQSRGEVRGWTMGGRVD